MNNLQCRSACAARHWRKGDSDCAVGAYGYSRTRGARREVRAIRGHCTDNEWQRTVVGNRYLLHTGDLTDISRREGQCGGGKLRRRASRGRRGVGNVRGNVDQLRRGGSAAQKCHLANCVDREPNPAGRVAVLNAVLPRQWIWPVTGSCAATQLTWHKRRVVQRFADVRVLPKRGEWNEHGAQP